VLAKRWHNENMTVKIIRNVPDEVRDKLAARAEIRHQSMQSYLLSELELIAAKPRNELVYERVTERLEQIESRVDSDKIVSSIKDGREW
jgi:hypothetical protein